MGYFVITTATTESAEDPAIKKALAAVRNKIDLMPEDRIGTAIEDGQTRAGTDVRRLAKLASAAVRARAGESRCALETLAAAAVRCIAS